jgi:outer membrane protein OmpA-like peptidoglycan-associated protein
VKRRFWISGKDERRRSWLTWLAFPGLIAAYAYGALVLVPRVDAGAIDASIAPAAEQSAVLADIGQIPQEQASSDFGKTDENVVDPLVDAPNSSERAEAVPSAESVQIAAESGEPGPDPCIAAMDAALSNARIEFLSSSVEIVPASRNVISVLAALAHACPGQIVIAGHSDNLGPEDANLQISLARAESVANTFTEFGLDPSRISVQGLGSAQPIADNNTRVGRARNRRIEMFLLTDDSSVSGE